LRKTYHLKIARKHAIFTLRAVVTPRMLGDKGFPPQRICRGRNHLRGR